MKAIRGRRHVIAAGHAGPAEVRDGDVELDLDVTDVPPVRPLRSGDSRIADRWRSRDGDRGGLQTQRQQQERGSEPEPQPQTSRRTSRATATSSPALTNTSAAMTSATTGDG